MTTAVVEQFLHLKRDYSLFEILFAVEAALEFKWKTELLRCTLEVWSRHCPYAYVQA